MGLEVLEECRQVALGGPGQGAQSDADAGDRPALEVEDAPGDRDIIPDQLQGLLDVLAEGSRRAVLREKAIGPYVKGVGP